MGLRATLSVTCLLLVACGARTGVSDEDAPPGDAGEPPVGCVGPEPVALARPPTGGTFHLAVDSTHVYFAQQRAGIVYRVRICGGELEVLASEQPFPFYVASDGTHVYWTNSHTAGAVLRRRIPDGPIEVLWEEGGQPEGLRLDGDHVYFTAFSSGGQGLWRMTRSGEDLRLVVEGRVGRDYAFDDTHVYVTERGRLLRAPKDGGAPEVLVEGDDAPFATVAVDATHVYWTSWIGPGSPVPNVLRMPKTGGMPEALAEGETGVVVGLGVTPTHVYWTSQSDGAVRGRSLAGGPVITIATDQPTVEHLAVTPRAIVWANFDDGTVWRAPRLRR